MRNSTGQCSSDEALITGIAASDEGALAALYDAYGGIAFGLALAMTSDQDRAEVVVAEAFAEMSRDAGAWKASRLSARAWMTAVVRRRAATL